MLSPSFRLMDFCVGSLRGEIRELAAHPFSQRLLAFLFAFRSHCRIISHSREVWTNEGTEAACSLSVVSLSARQTQQTGWQEELQVSTSDVKP